MFLTRYNANGLANVFSDSILDVVDNFWDSYHTNLELDEQDDSYLFAVELPGFDKKEVKVSSKDNILQVSAVSGEKKRSRSISLPSDSDTDHIKAKLKNGVLKIIVPKAKQHSHKITVE